MPTWSSQHVASRARSPQKLEGVFILPTSLSSVLDIKYKWSMQFSFFFFFGCNYSVCLMERKKEGEGKKEGTRHLHVKERHVCASSVEELVQKHFTFVEIFHPWKAEASAPAMVAPSLPCSETGWTHKPSFLASFYFSLLNWCHLIAVIFPPFVFSWAWVNRKCTATSHIALSKCRGIVEQSVFWGDIYSSRGAADGLNHWSRPSAEEWNSSIPKETTLFCSLTCSTYERWYREQNWGQHNIIMSTLHSVGPDLEENIAKTAADSALAFEGTSQGAKSGGAFVLWANFNQAPGRVNQLITHRPLARYEKGTIFNLWQIGFEQATEVKASIVHYPVQPRDFQFLSYHVACSEKVCQATAFLNKLHQNSLRYATYSTCLSKKSHIISF